MPGPQRGGFGGGGDRGGDARRPAGPPRRSRRRPPRRPRGEEPAARADRGRPTGSPRSSRVVGGSRFTALVVVGDGDGQVGVGYGKAKEIPAAIAKGVEEAKKHMFRVPRIASTIPHPVQGEAAAGVVLLRPASPVPASSPVDQYGRCSNVPEFTTSCSKSLGSDNPINIVHATIDGPASGCSGRRTWPPGAGCRSRTSPRRRCCGHVPDRGREMPDWQAEGHPGPIDHREQAAGRANRSGPWACARSTTASSVDGQCRQPRLHQSRVRTC